MLHNVAMAQLWELGVRGTTLDVAAAWKEALLLIALVVVAWKARRLPAVRRLAGLGFSIEVDRGPIAPVVAGYAEPDVLGFSLYPWNAAYSTLYASTAS